tara:strand:+ start:264 stop:494 length:231 start_codon:yes stop_codon:yes gene_type:complete
MKVELGDMIQWHPPDPDDTDIGWVVRIENRVDMELDDELTTLIYIKWIDGNVDLIWEHTVLEHCYITIIKGGQDDR